MKIPQKPWEYICDTQQLSDPDLETLQGLYQAEIAYLDHRIGEIVEFLQETGCWENTLLFVVGDHGENIGEHSLMDHQYCLYDTLLHVPLIVTGGPFEGLGANDRLVQLSDVFPTIVDILEINDEQAIEQFQGQSFAPSAPAREVAISEYLAPQPSIDSLEEKVGEVPAQIESFDRRLRAVRTNDWKLIRGSDGTRELYNVDADTDEMCNVISKEPDTAEHLEERLDKWLDSFKQAETDNKVDISKGVEKRLADLGYI